jgi:hypothetical protein
LDVLLYKPIKEVNMNSNRGTMVSRENVSRESALLFILAKIDQYKGEKEFFENKYGRDFYRLEQNTHSVKGREDFKLEEDLEDWEFAINSLEYWENEYHKIKSNAAVA